MRTIRFFHVDAFAERAFEGNPAAVCLLDQPLVDIAWAQTVAAEMNLSETAFVDPADEGGVFGLRWFTPNVEVALCGHATLAAAHALWSDLPDAGAPDPLRFKTKSGLLTAARVGQGANARIELDFPGRPPVSCEPPDGLLEALGLMPLWVGRSGEGDYVVVVDSADAVEDLVPDLGLLAGIEARGVIVTARCDGGCLRRNRSGQPPDFVSRFFGPAVGVDEDPVTGSAHCALAPYWARRLKKSSLLGYQASARGGFVDVEVCGDRVLLRGGAVTVVLGHLRA